MNEGTINELNDVIFNLELEGYYYYQDEENEADYFIAYQLIVVTSNQDNEDCEFELLEHIKSELNDENLIFTLVGSNSETHRIVGLPEIEYFNFENGNFTLLDDTNIVDAIEFLKNMKTINLNDLISENLYDNKNFRHVKSIEIEETDSNKTVIEKTYYENGEIKEEIDIVNDKWQGLYKLYHDNGQLKVVIRFEKGRQVDGMVNSYDENGMLIRKAEIRNGCKNGPFQEFYPSGTIKKEGEYKDDEIIGKPIEYFENGNIKAFEQSDFYKFFIKKTQEVLLNFNLKEKSIYNLFYDLETIQKTIIIGNKENILLNFAEIRIYSNKCEDQDDDHDSLGEIETPFIISYSSEIEDYILLTNFPKYVIDEDADNMNNDSGIRNLTFDELVNTFNEMKIIDMSKIKINDSDDFTYFEGGSIKEDNADEQIEVLESGIINSLVFNDKTAFVDKLKNLDESSIIEIRLDSKKWSINEKSIVTGDWNEKEYTLYADVLQKRADLMWEESLGELINLLAKNELGELNNDNCKSLYLDSSDGSDINVLKIEWDSSLTDEEEEQFKDEYGDDGSQLYYDGDLEVELFFEIGAIIGVRVITENEELYLSAEDNEIEEEEEEEGNKQNTARAMVLLDDEDKKEMENTGWLLHILAFGYFLTGDFISAIASIDKVIKLDIDEECESSEHYTTRAKIYLKLDNNEKAIEDLKKALELDPNFEEANDLLKSLKK